MYIVLFFKNFEQISRCEILRTKCVLTKFVKSDVNRLYPPKISYNPPPPPNKQRPKKDDCCEGKNSLLSIIVL